MQDELFKEVGIVGTFSDFPATVSTYVNCVLGPYNVSARREVTSSNTQ